MNRLRIAGFRWWVLPLIVLLVLAVFLASQLGISTTEPPVIAEEVVARETANYDVWQEDTRFNQISPLLGTLIAEENLSTASALMTLTGAPPQIAFNPTPGTGPEATSAAGTQGALVTATYQAIQTQIQTAAIATLDAATTATANVSATAAATVTQEAMQSATAVITETRQAMMTQTAIQAATETARPTQTPTPTASFTPSSTPTATPTRTPTATVTASVTPSRTPTATITASVTPSRTPAPTLTRTPSITPSRTVTSTPRPTLTPQPTNTPLPTPPEARFSYNQLTTQSPFSVRFNNLSTGQVTSYLWTFGDGTSSTEVNPNHSYTNPGFYAVTLTVTGPGGSDSAAANINITQQAVAPNADFRAIVVDGTLTVNFVNASSGNITGYAWNFGDGGSSTLTNPSHTYGAPGTYNITLTATGPGGSDSITVALVIVSPVPPPTNPPDASFTANPTSGIAPLTVNFTNASTGNITGYTWNFGDGIGTSAAVNPAYTFTGPGTYSVTLTAFGPGGTDSHTVMIQVAAATQAPNADFTSSAGLGTPSNTLINFTNLSTGDITSYAWTFGDGVGSSTEINPSYTYTAPGTYTVTLTVTGPGGTDSHSETVVIAAPADIALIMSVNPTSAREGQNVTYSITVSNPSASSATGVSVGHNLPPGLSYVSHTATHGNYTAGTWIVGAVPAGQIASVDVTFTVSGFTGTFGVDRITVTATATLVENDPNTANNSTSVTLDVIEADLNIDISADNVNLQPGDTVVFTVSARNNGGRNASATVSVPLAANLTYVSDSAGGSYTGGNWNIGNLPSGATRTMTLTARIAPTTSSQTITQTASISAPQYDPVTGNNSRSVQLQIFTTDVSINYAIDNASPLEGAAVTYTVAVVNNGPQAAPNVTVAGILPAKVTYISHTTATGTYTPGGNWSIGSLVVGQTAVLTVRATVNPITDGIVTASSTAAVTLGLVDYNTANNSATVTFTVPSADLQITKTVSNATPNRGNSLRYTLTVRNNGSIPATGVTVTDLLPADVTYVGDSSGGAYAGSLWTVGSIPAGGTVTLTIDVTVNAAAPTGIPITNGAVVDATQYDPTPGNNSSSVTFTIPSADLVLSIAPDAAPYTPNADVQLAVTLTNNGPNTATNIVVNGGEWAVPSLASGASTSTSITYRIPGSAVGPITVTKSITAADQFDPNSANNTASVTLTAVAVNLRIQVDASKETPARDTELTYSLNISNPSTLFDATSVTITDVIPDHLTYVSDNAGGNYDAGTRTWTADIGTLKKGTFANYQLVVLVESTMPVNTPVENFATITAAEYEIDNTDNTDSVIITLPTIDLQVTMVVDNAAPAPGETLTFTITLTNAHPTLEATLVRATTILPAQLIFTGSTPSGGFDTGTGLWTARTLAPQESVVLILQTQVDPATPIGTDPDISTSVTGGQPDDIPTNNTITIPVRVS